MQVTHALTRDPKLARLFDAARLAPPAPIARPDGPVRHRAEGKVWPLPPKLAALAAWTSAAIFLVTDIILVTTLS